MDDALRSALGAAFPDRDVDDVRGTGPSWNDANRTVAVAFADGGRAYLKVAADGDGTRVARERAVLAYAGATCGVAVPRVLASDPDADVPYLATAPLAGRSLLEPWAAAGEPGRAELARRVGRALATVHADRFEAHGQVTGGGADGLDVRTAPWPDVLAERIEGTRELAPCDRFDGHFDDVLAAVAGSRDLLDDAPAALVHGDPAKPNCFVDDDGVGLVDWELAHVGDPARELHRARDQLLGGLRTDAPDRLVAALREGYADRAGGLPDGFAERRPVYGAVRFLGVSGYFDRWAEFADEPRDELAAWVDAEMDRRLAALQ